MAKWIKRAHETINDTIEKLIKDNEHMANTHFRVAVIGYRDVLDRGRFMEKEFTEDIESVKKFMSSFQAQTMEQNVDRPEDVAGALKMALM